MTFTHICGKELTQGKPSHTVKLIITSVTMFTGCHVAPTNELTLLLAVCQTNRSLPVKIPVFIFSTRDPAAFLEIVHQDRLILVAHILHTAP